MRTVWLLRGDDVLASADVAEGVVEKARGLVGRSRHEGTLLVMGTRSVHTAWVRRPLDVAFLDRQLVVVALVRLGQWRLALPRRGACNVLEAEAGSFERWRLQLGDQLELREIDRSA